MVLQRTSGKKGDDFRFTRYMYWWPISVFRVQFLRMEMERSGCDQDDAIRQSNRIASAIAQSSASGRTKSGVGTGGDVAIREFNVVDHQDPEREMIESQETVTPPSRLLIRYLYIGHFLARWGARFFSLSSRRTKTETDISSINYDSVSLVLLWLGSEYHLLGSVVVVVVVGIEVCMTPNMTIIPP